LSCCAESALRPQSDSSMAWAMVTEAGTPYFCSPAIAPGATAAMNACCALVSGRVEDDFDEGDLAAWDDLVADSLAGLAEDFVAAEADGAGAFDAGAAEADADGAAEADAAEAEADAAGVGAAADVAALDADVPREAPCGAACVSVEAPCDVP
jgi:hypothetical protein